MDGMTARREAIQSVRTRGRYSHHSLMAFLDDSLGKLFHFYFISETIEVTYERKYCDGTSSEWKRGVEISKGFAG
ncbi:hypothetical protein SAMN05421754_103022 [Nitrosomonas sp. Nm58]|nr:hypothetical protein SAMN05421754_103022 [Nitrosomonas sp. Nm58]